ncbi:hypothetical protein XH99_00040 [Bradyrhizobium nanningense]|uniref:Uncharacterized protein n=1 Tax=Bradyrhizobium nanningense TaxID=1325118 RepID=A0A4Q0SLM7_9BRAD|nr:hypothetical protein XH99_00040 [Bradyrhizobium nanningense]
MVDLLDRSTTGASDAIAPLDALIQTVKEATPPLALKASRPMCRYPNYPHYIGGDRYLSDSCDCRNAAP